MSWKLFFEKISAKKTEIVFFALVFLIFFRFDSVPLQTDDWHIPVSAKTIFEKGFSKETLDILNGYQALARPLTIVLFLPFYAVFGSNYALAMPFYHLLLSLLALLLVYFNFRLFEKIFGKPTAFLSSFLLAASFFVVYSFWYTASANIAIATLCLVATIYFLTKISDKNSKYFAAFLMVFGMLTRETVVIAFFLVILAFFITNKKARTKPNFAVLFLPFVLFAIVMLLLTGFILQPLHSGMMSTSMVFENLSEYFVHLFGYYLLNPIIAFAVFVFLISAILATRKNLLQSIKNQFFLPWFSLSERQNAVVLLIAAFVGGLVPLAVAAQTSPRYVVPVLPIVFGFTAKFFCDSVFEKLSVQAKKFFIAFLLVNLVFWVLFFNVKNLLGIFGNNWIDVLSLAFNALFFLIVLSAPAFALFYFLKTKKTVSRFFVLAALVIMSFLLALSSIVQLNELNVFYVTHYHNSSIAFEANKFLAENTRPGITVFSEQDLSWIFYISQAAFSRTDFNVLARVPDYSELREGDLVVYNSRAAPQTFELIQKNREKFELLASFGGTTKKYPRTSLEKMAVLKTGTLFGFFWDSAERIEIYKFK